mgnify:CR=1 FL=1
MAHSASGATVLKANRFKRVAVRSEMPEAMEIQVHLAAAAGRAVLVATRK